MKKIVSLLAVALFATIFATGCGKPEKCSDVTDAKKCVESDTFKTATTCVWNATDKKCEAPQVKYTKDATDEGHCTGAIATTKDKPSCDKGTALLSKAATDAGYACVFAPAGTGTPPTPATCLLQIP